MDGPSDRPTTQATHTTHTTHKTAQAMTTNPPEPLLDVDDARARILALAAPLAAERVPLTSLVGAPPRVLAEGLTSKRALPPFSNSAMDGYAVRSVDVAAATKAHGTQLRIVAESRAGQGTARALGAGEAIAITTGAPIPAGVDAVVMRELCDESGVKDGVVVVHAAAAAGENVRVRGEDVDVGGVVGHVGDVVTPARLNLLLSAGHTNVSVVRRPTVGILASGDELEEIGDGGFGRERSGDDVIVNSNAWAIAMAASRAGADVRLLGIAKDTLDDHKAKMDVDDVDVLITIGGVSMGAHDHVRPALLALGATLHLWKVAMRPGKPLAFGTLPRRRRPVLVLGLPGNPVSSLVTFTLFGVPLLLRLAGRHTELPTTKAVLRDAVPFKKKRGLTFFSRAIVDDKGGVTTLERQGSGQISGLAAANALAVFAKDVEVVDVGAVVDVIRLS